jgi:hypothetical protein
MRKVRAHEFLILLWSIQKQLQLLDPSMHFAIDTAWRQIVILARFSLVKAISFTIKNHYPAKSHNR